MPFVPNIWQFIAAGESGTFSSTQTLGGFVADTGCQIRGPEREVEVRQLPRRSLKPGATCSLGTTPELVFQANFLGQGLL